MVVQSFALHDFIGQDWKNDLVSFAFKKTLSAQQVAGLSLLGPDNGEVPFQAVTAGGTTRIYFLAGLPAYGQSTYRMVSRKLRSPASPFVIEEKADALRVSNGVTGVEVPTAAGDYTNGPIRAVRMKSGAWIGGSRLVTKRTIVSYQARIVRRGPVFVDIECHYRFTGDKSWTLNLRVIAGEPVVLIRESFDLDDDSVWEFCGNRNFPVNTALVRVGEDTAYSAPSINYDDGNPLKLCPWVAWWDRKNTKFFGLFHVPEGATVKRDDAQKRLTIAPEPPAAQGTDDDMLVATAGDVAAWARSGPKVYDNAQAKSIAVKAGKDGALAFQMQLAAPGRSWLLGASSVQENLVADGSVAPVQKLMNRYCETPLDEVKDMTLQWNRKASFPRLVVKADDIKKIVAAPDFRERLALNPASQSLKSVVLPLIADRNAPKDRAKVDAVKADVLKRLDGLVEHFRYGNYNRNAAMFGSIAVRRDTFDTLLPLDLALGAGIFTPGEEERIFAQLAFVAEKIAGPDYVSPGRSLAGNPNMVTAWCASRVLMACMMPDHPHAKQWYREAMDRIDGMLDKWQGPTGAWLEAPHYQTVALDAILIAKIAAHNAGFAGEAPDERVLRPILFLAKISTPRDPRFENRRHYPPLGNTYLMETSSIFGAVAKVFRQQDPQRAAQLQWMWQEQGKPRQAGLGGDFMLNFYKELMMDDDWQAPAPDWKSEDIPGFGAVLRSGFNTDRETYMVYHQGDVATAHYDDDQGSFEMWGKGRPLSLDWGYNGYAPAMQHNRLEVGTSGKVVEFAAAPEADYLHGQQNGGWDRQILFLKDADPAGPNYFVIRDTTRAGGKAGWWLWINTRKDESQRKAIEIDGDTVRATGESDVDLDVWFAPPSDERLKSLEIKTMTVSTVKGLANGGWTGSADGKTTQQGLHLNQTLGEPLVAVLYPRLHDEALARFTALADGKVLKIVTPAGTDYAFLATEPFEFQEGEVRFQGTAGVIQVRGSKVTCTLGAAGEITYGQAHWKSLNAGSKTFDAF
jgi:hypothetical protein